MKNYQNKSSDLSNLQYCVMYLIGFFLTYLTLIITSEITGFDSILISIASILWPVTVATAIFGGIPVGIIFILANITDFLLGLG